MSEVALKIGGRTYRVACAAGEEDRVKRLGKTIDEKLATMGPSAGPGEQNLLFAALLLADEVQEARDGGAGAAPSVDSEAEAQANAALSETIAELEAEIARLQSAAAETERQLKDASDRETGLREQIDRQDAEAVRHQSEITELRAAQAAAEAVRPTGEDLGSLAPALEGLAQMLEECADKLERRSADA